MQKLFSCFIQIYGWKDSLRSIMKIFSQKKKKEEEEICTLFKII